MKRAAFIVCVALLLSAGASHDAITAPDTGARDKGAGSDTSFESWARERAGPWSACAILGTYHYVKYLYDKSNWVNLVLFSRYLEDGGCFWRDYERAAAIYREGAKAGREVSALYLGYLYLKGLGVERDVKEARRWFDLGVLYHIDAPRQYQIDHTRWIMGHRGMPPELMDAIDRGRKKFLGDGRDILAIAKSLQFGTEGMTRNKDAAKKLYSIADRTLLGFARTIPANEPVFKNIQAGFEYYRKRLENAYQARSPENRKYEIYISLKQIYEFATWDNHGPSQKLIAEVFRTGRHVKRDFFIAYVFFRFAQINGLPVGDQIKGVRARLTPEQIAEAEDDIRERKITHHNYRQIRQKKLPRKPEPVVRRGARDTGGSRSSKPTFKNFEEKFRYYKRRLANSVRVRDPMKRRYEIYWSVLTIYDFATFGEHAPSQKIIAGLFEAGELVPKDLFVAYVFYGSAKLNGLDTGKEIGRVRKFLTPDQIAEADKDIRDRKVFRKYHYRDIRKKLPKDPY